MHRKERDHYEQKIIPTFESEAAEREFWENHDSGDYLDWSLAKRVTMPNLKPTTQSISLRLPIPCGKISKLPPTAATCRTSR